MSNPVVEKYARSLSHEELIEEYLSLMVRYEERGIAMQETGDMVRSLYAPKLAAAEARIRELEGELTDSRRKS